MRPYLLLTPGPLTTSESVKTAMMTDWCTWDVNPEKPDVPLNKNDAFQKVQKRHVQEKR